MELNPNFQYMLRTHENAMPAVTTELDFTNEDVLRFMIQTGRFRNENGTLAQDRIEAAKEYLNWDWVNFKVLRYSCKPGFDPERPFLDEEMPDWREKYGQELKPYLDLRDRFKELESIFKGGPNKEYHRAENALIMCQRVDLWCAGPDEVEAAVIHLYKLGRALNKLEVEYPRFIMEFIPGADDMAEH